MRFAKIAAGFVRGGAKVYISARSAKDCQSTADELNKLGPGTCIPLPANMQHVAEVDKLVAELTKREKVLHVLVNNAGAAWGDDIDSYPVCTAIQREIDKVMTHRQGRSLHEACHIKPSACLYLDTKVFTSSSSCSGE
jgi:NADP-dependent 3-hydroxy acid dehydrogenase YdfG